MLNPASLSLDQAPPISIPFRFFITAPLFGLAAGLLLVIYGPSLFLTRWSPMTLGLTHLLTLGMLAMVMCGALLQMLPVIAGSPVPAVVAVGTVSHLLITAGTGLLVVAFMTGNATANLLALIMLGSGIGLFFIVIAIALWRVKTVTHTITAMRVALAAFLITLLFGLLLASGFLSSVGFGHIAQLVNVHLGWGVLGWIGLLLIGLSYQVVPMFQVTPEYPERMRRFLAPGLFTLLLVWSVLMLAAAFNLIGSVVPVLIMFLLMPGFIFYAVITLRLQRQRKRRVPDITMQFWRIGMLAILSGAAIWGFGRLFSALATGPQFDLLLGVVLIVGAGLSVVNGMLYKIVPFLSWFHLQNRQLSLMCMTVQVPNMKEFITDKSSRLQFKVYLVSLVLLLAAVIKPAWFAHIAGIVFMFSNLLLLKNLSMAMIRYRKTNQALLAYVVDSEVK
ncbi:MAG: hypothetical protein OQL27_12490 [Sedimenticola sp.]|nr:hypothetical protein [Sedimenticola sp.]